MSRHEDSSEGPLDVSEGTSFGSTFTGGNTSIIAGKLKSLQMVNFMCHTNIELNFSERINFITGKNGSGKSAIMAALMVTLGGTASQTQRGSSVTDFIKKGETWASVTLTLTNEGFNSHKREIYGNLVVIQRTISASGRHSYICKSASGAIVSKKKEEVDNIVQAFNIQLKNPICILTQDVARSFLCTSNSSLRFSLFSNATQLEQVKMVHEKTLDVLDKSRADLLNKQKGIQESRAELKELKAKLKFFASLEERVNERTNLENEYVWALVTSEEEILNNLRQTENELLEKKEEYLNEESKFEGELKKLNEKLKQCQKHLEEAIEEKSKKTIEKLNIQKEAQNLEKEVVKTETELVYLTEKFERQLVDMNAIQKHIQDFDNIAIQSQTEKDQVNKKIIVLQQKLSDLKEKVANTDRNLKEAQKMVYLQSRNVEQIRADLGELEQNKKRLEISLGEVKAKGQNNYAKFGYHTQDILHAIEEANKQNCFLRRPIGPCGMHVRLTGDTKWARAVEFAIGGLMTTYRCDNQKDFLVLSKIMEKICGKKHPAIIIGKFLPSRHNVEAKKVSVRGFQSILDVLTFDNNVVFNTFVDQAQIEGILLFENDEQAASILTNIQNVPKNVKMGLTLQSDQYYPAPNYRTYYGNSKRPLRYFDAASKSADAVEKLEIELKGANRRIVETNLELEKVREASRESCALVEECKHRLKDLKQEEGNVEVELNQMKDMEETQPVPVRKAALEEELERLVKEHKACLEDRNRCREALERLKETRNESVRKLNAVAIDEDEAEKKVDELESNVQSKAGKRRMLLERHEEAGERLEENKRRLKEVKESVRKSKADVEKKIKAAEEVCPERVETSRSPVEVQKLLEDCEKYLKAAEKVAVSREATIEEYKVKQSMFKQMKKTALLFENSVESLKKSSAEKEQYLKILQSHTSNLVSLYFQATLRTRGYDGELKIDFNRKLLDLEVKSKDATMARSDSKTLSGGERSYCMVSFILAVWKVVNMPFYFLDEFDVFMDRVNRKVVIDLLLEHARAQSNKQFIFITPQDISDIQPSEIITIYKMPDPERRG